TRHKRPVMGRAIHPTARPSGSWNIRHDILCPLSPPPQMTQLLVEWSKGNQAARDQLMPLVYDELRRMARRYMNQQNPGHTLQTTALIHEAYLRLTGDSDR